MVAVQTQGAAPQLEDRGPIAIVFSHAKIASAGEQRGKKNESFSGGYDSKRLIDVGAGGCGQMGKSNPNQHQAAHGAEFQSSSGWFWLVFAHWPRVGNCRRNIKYAASMNGV